MTQASSILREAKLLVIISSLAFCENLGNLTRLEREKGVGRLKVPLKGGVRRWREISLSVSFKNIGEVQ